MGRPRCSGGLATMASLCWPGRFLVFLVTWPWASLPVAPAVVFLILFRGRAFRMDSDSSTAAAQMAVLWVITVLKFFSLLSHCLLVTRDESDASTSPVCWSLQQRLIPFSSASSSLYLEAIKDISKQIGRPAAWASKRKCPVS